MPTYIHTYLRTKQKMCFSFYFPYLTQRKTIFPFSRQGLKNYLHCFRRVYFAHFVYLKSYSVKEMWTWI